MDIVVSVIIPSYNGEQTIARAISSVLKQDGDFSIEILVCDDCSTDKTIEIAKQMKAIVLSNKKHIGGPNVGRNLGIRNAKGRYIAFLDQDDEWLPEKLETQLKQIKDYDVISSDKIIRNE